MCNVKVPEILRSKIIYIFRHKCNWTINAKIIISNANIKLQIDYKDLLQSNTYKEFQLYTVKDNFMVGVLIIW